jgi:galactokinase
VARFNERFGRAPTSVVSAPGRVNLIGEHTDYSGGLVLPMAIPHRTAIALEAIDGHELQVLSDGFGEATVDLTADPARAGGWTQYLHGMFALLSGEGQRVRAWRGAIASDIPDGAGLSSSAALEVASGLASLVAGQPELDAVADETRRLLAALGTRVENDLLGLPSGIMDQLASACGVAGSALLIDCQTASIETVPLADDLTVVVLDTGTRRELVDSAFAERRIDSERAAEFLQLGSLRQAQPSDIDRFEQQPVLQRRVRHVVCENQRTVALAKALSSGDRTDIGAIMAEAHHSLAEDYEVSSPALDAMVAAATTAPGIIGARMTGGGFAGCAVAVVDRESVEAFVEHLVSGYRPPAAQPPVSQPAYYPVEPSAGTLVERV